MPIRTYLDTGVLIAAFQGDHDLHKAAFSIIDDPDRDFLVSDFLRLELLPKPVFHRKDSEVEFYKAFFDSASQHLAVTQQSTEAAFSLACQYGLGPIDALHVSAALEASAAEFITNEKATKPFFNIVSGTTTIHSLFTMPD